ncbi:MAG: hypothetical protein Q8R98_17840 [Rubrivivax sp.]|nr:hypothetical protein [Rubrivivax sp.]
MTDITPAEIIAAAPLGALIRFSNGEPMPPTRFNKKLRSWQDVNGVGTLTEVNPSLGTFTLHMGDMGSGDVIIMRVYRTYTQTSQLTFRIERTAEPGAVLCATVWQGKRKIDKVTDLAGAETWLGNNTYGELLTVGADGALTVLRPAREAA